MNDAAPADTGSYIVQEAPHVVFLSSWLRFPEGMAATNRVRLLARALHEAGTPVRVLIMQAGERPPVVENRAVRGLWHGIPFEFAAGTTVRHDSFVMRRLIELRGWTAGALRLVALRRAGELDAVYLWFTAQRWQPKRAVYVALLRALGVPVMIELNERPWAVRPDRTIVERVRSPLAGVAGAIAISAYLRDWALAEGARLGRAVDVVEVPILVDLDEVVPAPYGEGPPAVVFAGAPVYDEALEFIFSAMETVWRSFPECRLIVTGANSSDPAARWLQERADAGRLERRIDVVGYLPRQRLLETYGVARALLAPLFEDVVSQARFPTKIGEYLASARPVVTTTVGEMARHLADGETAYMCAPGDARAYGEKICEVLADPVRAAAIGAAGREVARASFDYSQHGDRLREAFERISVARPALSGNERWTGSLERVTARRRRFVGSGRLNIAPQTDERTAKVLVAGDLSLTRVSAPPDPPWPELVELLREQDLAIVNIECALTTRAHRIAKSGPALVGDPVVAGLAYRGGFTMASLANNHVGDAGPDGVVDTIAACRDAGLSVVGAGRNLDEARRPCIVEARGLRIAVLAFAEREFGVAGQGAPGTAPLDGWDSTAAVRAAAADADVVIVLVHGGNEHYDLPRPGLVRACRALAAAGAHAVVCDHSHVPGGLEVVAGAPIVYGTGNYLFPWSTRDGGPPNKRWRQGLVVGLTVGTPGVTRVELHPVSQDPRRVVVAPADGAERQELLDHTDDLSAIIADPAALARAWALFSADRRRFLLADTLGLNRVERRLLRHGRWPSWRYRKDRLPELYDVIACDSHREALETVLDQEMRRG